MIGNILRVRYEITQLIGETPVFRAYTAKDKVQAREVCIRVLKEPFAADQDFVAKLSEVVHRVGAIRNPSLEELVEVDSDETATFLVSELTSGSSLADRLKKLATFSVPASIEAGISICDALQSVHRAGMAHGDIGAHSVWMRPDGDLVVQTPCLWEAYYVSTQAKDAVLSADSAYVAPEISRGGFPTPLTDVYSIGVLLFQLLTGRLPFRGDTAIAMALQHATEPIPSAKQINPSIPANLDGIVKKAMAKAPAERYADAGEFLSDLRILQDALRFGKAVNWPFNSDKTSAQTPAAPSVVATPAQKPLVNKPTPVPKPTKAPRQQEDADVPAWLRLAIVFVGGIVCVVVVIFLVVNFDHPKEVAVPDLKRMTVNDAVSKLKVAGLSLYQKKQEPSEQFPIGTIISTDPPSGAKVYQSTVVSAVVSAGSRFIEVPDLRGMTVDKAREALTAIELDLDDNVEQKRDRNAKEGDIISQNPAPRQKYERHTKVHVVISSGRGTSDSGSDPQANTKYLYNVKVTLTDAEEPVNLRVDMTDSKGTKTVYEQKHVPNDEVPVRAEGYGSHVTFRIFYNNELVKQVEASADGADSSSSDQTQ